MKKKGEKKRVRMFKGIRDTFQYKLLIICLIILVVLLVVYIFVYESRIEDEDLEGELGTLKWDFDEEEVVFQVVGYNITNNNQTIQINFTRISGNRNVYGAMIIFNRTQGGCNISGSDEPEDFPAIGEYLFSDPIQTRDTTCEPSNFTNITEILIYAQIDILTQTTIPIPDITLYNDDSLIDIFDLDDYFNSLVNISYDAIESPSNDYLIIKINETTHLVSFIRGVSWYGTQEFNLTATSDGDVLDVSTSGSNMSFSVIFIDENAPIPNEAPDFNSTYCDDLVWEVNTNYILNMTKCWSDEDGDELTYRYANVSGHNDNLSISRSGVKLTLSPDNGWIGYGYFYVYANDSKVEESGRVDFYVRNTTSSNVTENVTTNEPEIKSSTPTSSSVSIFAGDNKTFSITAENYDEIKWYLNGGLLAGGGLSLEFNDLKEGDIVKVEVINGTRIDSKTWNIKIEKDEVIEQPIFNAGSVMFYLIIAVIVIIIGLIIWLFLAEKNRKSQLSNVGFGISSQKSVGHRPSGQQGASNQFNIPK